MRVSSINNTNFYRANFNKANNNTVPVYKEINAKELDALSFTGISGQYGVKKYVPQEVQSAIDEFNKTDKAAQTLAKNAQKHFEEAEKDIISKGKKANKESQKIYNETIATLIKGNKTDSDGTVLRRIKKEDNTIIMEEFDKYGEIKKISTLNGKSLKVQEGIEELDDGTLKIAKEMKFENGELREYIKGYEESLDGSKKVEQEMHFNYGYLGFYKENYEKRADRYEKTQKEANLLYGRMLNYTENKEKLADGTKSTEALYTDDKYEFNKNTTNGTTKIQKALLFTIDGELCRYTENDEIFPDGSRAIDKNINYDDDAKPLQYQKDYQKSTDGTWKKAFVISFKDGKANNCIMDIKGSAYGLESLKEYELSNNSWKKVK